MHSTLRQARVEPPFVLVGHSLAGPLSLIFADLFPSEVAGLVFVDATDPDAVNRAPPELAPTEEMAKDLALRRATMTLMAEFGISRFMNRNFRAPQERVAYIFEVGRRFNPQQIAAGGREVAALPAILDRASDAGPFGDTPVVVLTAERWNPGTLTPEQSQVARALRLELQAELAALSTNGTHRIVEDSGHTMMLDAPDETTRAILEVVDAARTGSNVMSE